MPIEVFCRVKDGDICHNTTGNSCCINFTYGIKPFSYTINQLWDQYSNNITISYDLLKRADEYNNFYIVAFGYTGSLGNLHDFRNPKRIIVFLFNL